MLGIPIVSVPIVAFASHMSLHNFVIAFVTCHCIHTTVTAFVTCHYLTLPGRYLLLHTYVPPIVFITIVCHLCHFSCHVSLPSVTLHLRLPQANSTVAEEVHAPRWLHRFIIGRKGQNLREITENLPKLHLEFNADKDAIFLEGPQVEVLQAKSKLEDFTKDLVRGRGRGRREEGEGSLNQSLCMMALTGGLSEPNLTVIWLFSR